MTQTTHLAPASERLRIRLCYHLARKQEEAFLLKEKKKKEMFKTMNLYSFGLEALLHFLELKRKFWSNKLIYRDVRAIRV